MAQTQQGARKQNWLLTGVTVGSIILAILGWTRKVDCACPKDFNATVSSSVKGLGEGLGVPVGARVVDAKGMAIRVGAPPQGAAAPLGRPAAQGVGTGSAAGSTNLTNTRGPLGVGRGIGTTGGVAGGGNFRADGTPFNGGGDGFARNNGGNGIGGTGRGVGGAGNPSGGSGGSGLQNSPNGQPAGATSSTSGGSQGTGSTSGGSQLVSTSTTGGVTSTSSTTSGGAVSTTGGGTVTSTGGTGAGSTSTTTTGGTTSGGRDPFGPRDPNMRPNGDHGGATSGGRGPNGGPGGIGNPGGEGPGGDSSGGRGPNGGANGNPRPGAGGPGNGWFDGFHFGDRDHGSGATDVPEPGTFGLMGIGVAGLAFASWRRRRAKAGDAPQPQTNEAEGAAGQNG